MSANQAFAGPITYKGRSYPRLTMKQYGELEGALREYRRDTLQAALDKQRNLTPVDKAQQAAALELKPVTWFDVDDWLQTYDGAAKAIRLSLGTDADSALEGLSILDAQRIARLVLGTLEQIENPPSAA